MNLVGNLEFARCKAAQINLWLPTTSKDFTKDFTLALSAGM
jgi:hypothetical protein